MADSGRANVNTLEPFWMPFTANRQFKSAPRMVVSAKDMHYTTDDGRKLLDGSAGMWCVNAGHGLTLENVGAVARLPHVQELNIGYAIVARALIVGVDAAVREMKSTIEEAEA